MQNEMHAIEEKIKAEKRSLQLKKSEHLLMSTKLFTENSAPHEPSEGRILDPPPEHVSGSQVFQDRNFSNAMKCSEDLEHVRATKSTATVNAR